MSLTCGMPPAMELSGMPEFLGGGSAESNVLGWYAEAVTNFRFEESRLLIDDVNCRAAYGHDCECLEKAEEASLVAMLDEFICVTERGNNIVVKWPSRCRE